MFEPTFPMKRNFLIPFAFLLTCTLLPAQNGISDPAPAAAYERLHGYMQTMQVAIESYGRTDLTGYHEELDNAYRDRSWSVDQIETALKSKDEKLYAVWLEPVNTPERKIQQRVQIDLVEASFPVEFSQAVGGGHHYVAYFDKNKDFCIAYRKLNESSFRKTVLNSKIEWDSHNYTAIVVDPEGYIHVSGNMHNVPLNYWRSTKPYDASKFEAIHRMTGSEESLVTYPKFLKTASGELLFHYRSGGSGNGFEVFNIWKPETKTWSRFIDTPLIDGLGERNAYMKGPFYEQDGFYHLYWVWRETPDCSTNHTFSYARSKDLKHWEDGFGLPVRSPLVYDEVTLAVDRSAKQQGTGILNGVQAHALDSQHRIVLCNMKYDEHGNSQLYVYRAEQGSERWNEKRITNWSYRFEFSGWGSIVFEIQLKGMRRLESGNIGIHYFHSKYGEGEIVLDEQSLEPLAVREWKPNYPAMLDLVTTKGSFHKPIEVRMLQQENFILRWETMAANNDLKPEGPLPEPCPLEFIELHQ